MSGRSTVFTFIGEDKFSKVAGQVEKKAGGMSGKIGKVGKVAAVGFAAVGTAAVAAGFALADMAKQAAEDEKSQVKLATVLKNTTKATDDQIAKVEAWISATGEATGVADDQMRPALTRLLASTKDTAEAQALMKVAMDASTATGKPLQTVVEALGKAHDGNTGALGRLGIATKDADGKTLSFEQTVKGMNKTFGGATAAAADTVEGKFGRLKLMFDETKETIGAGLLPVLSNIGTWIFEKGIPAVRQFAERMLPKLRDIWDGIRKTIDDNRPGLEKLGAVLAVVGGFVATKVVPALLKFQSVITRGLIIAVSKLGDILPPIVSGWLRGLANLVAGFKGLYNGVTASLSGILTVAEKTMGWIPGIGDKIRTAKAGFESFRSDSVSKLGAVETALRGAADKVDTLNSKAKKPTKLTVDASDLTAKVNAAKSKMGELKDRNVTVTATLTLDKLAVTQGVRNKIAAAGGRLMGMAGGGLVRGPGTGTSDSVVRALSSGEYVMRAAAVDRYGVGFFDALNDGMTARTSARGTAGAPVGSPAPLTVQLVLDGRVIQQSIVSYERSTGRPILTAGVA